MMFDFSNYVYSAIISFIAMAVGMAYPVVLQAIQRIEDIYFDDLMVSRLKEENVYKTFNTILRIAILGGFIIPFLMYIFDNLCLHVVSLILLSIQTLITFYLIFNSLSLYKIILVYYSTDKLLQHLDKDVSNDNFPQRMRILLCAAKSGNYEIYDSAKDSIFSRIIDYHKTFYKDPINKNARIEYPDNVYYIFYEIIKASAKKERFDYLYKDNELACTLYRSDILISHKTLHVLWNAINQTTDADCFDWFRQYWTYAEEYYRFFPKYEHGDVLENEIRNEMSHMHFMVGSLMLYKQKYSWIDFMFNFNQNSFAPYPLVPSNFESIFNELKRSYNEISTPWNLTNNFCFSGMTLDLNSDTIIYKYSEYYAALLLLRLYNNTNSAYNISLPPINEDYFSNKVTISICKKLLQTISDLSKNENFETLMKSKYRVVLALYDLIQKAERKNKKLKNTTSPKMASLLLEEIKKEWNFFPGLQYPPVKYETLGTREFISVETMINKDMISEAYNVYNLNFASTLIKNLYKKVYNIYVEPFLKFSAKKTYNVLYKDIPEAFRKMQLNKDYSILSLGIDINPNSTMFSKEKGFRLENDLVKYNDSDLYLIDSDRYSSCIILLKNEDLPRLSFSKESKQSIEGFQNLDSDSNVYYNDEQDIEKNLRVKMGRFVDLENFGKEIKYVKLLINYDSTLGNGDLNSIEAINNIIG